MNRLHFTTDDLAHTCIACAPDPFLETVLGAELLRHRATGMPYRAWSNGLRGKLDNRVLPLASVIPPDRRGLDLPALVGPITEFETAPDRLLGMNRTSVRKELEWLAGGSKVRIRSNLGDADPSARQELATAAAVFYQVAVQPHWPQIHKLLQAERTALMRLMARAGIGEVLSTLYPERIRWRSPVVELSTEHDGRDIELGGRGLLLVPSVFVGPQPYLSFDVADSTARPRLIYPVLRDLPGAAALWTAHRADGGLARLVGRTRSAVLEAVAHGRGTVEIARQLGLSAATVSEHITILRSSGLIVTSQDGASRTHTLTTAGEVLLNGSARRG